MINFFLKFFLFVAGIISTRIELGKEIEIEIGKEVTGVEAQVGNQSQGNIALRGNLPRLEARGIGVRKNRL